MIVINKQFFPNKESIDLLIEELMKNSYKDVYKDLTQIYAELLYQCLDADIKLQQMVLDNISDDFISFVILPILEIEDLDSFSFELASLNEDVHIKKRDELKYQEYCDICFGNIKPLYTRFYEYFNSP